MMEEPMIMNNNGFGFNQQTFNGNNQFSNQQQTYNFNNQPFNNVNQQFNSQPSFNNQFNNQPAFNNQQFNSQPAFNNQTFNSQTSFTNNNNNQFNNQFNGQQFNNQPAFNNQTFNNNQPAFNNQPLSMNTGMMNQPNNGMMTHGSFNNSYVNNNNNMMNNHNQFVNNAQPVVNNTQQQQNFQVHNTIQQQPVRVVQQVQHNNITPTVITNFEVPNKSVATTPSLPTTNDYTPSIKWSCAPSSIINNSAFSDLIGEGFTADDLRVQKSQALVNTKLFCMTDQVLRTQGNLRPSTSSEISYPLAEMEAQSSWVPNDRIAPKKSTHNCLVNDWLIFCSQDPQLVKLVGKFFDGTSNSPDVQIFADFVLVSSNNHDEDSKESLFGKQRFKGGIPLHMKWVRSPNGNNNTGSSSQQNQNVLSTSTSTNNSQAGASFLLYFERRINRESVNNKEAPSASGMGGKRVAQLRIYLKHKDQEVCLVHSEGFWVRTKSREEIQRSNTGQSSSSSSSMDFDNTTSLNTSMTLTPPNNKLRSTSPSSQSSKKKRNPFSLFNHGSSGSRMKNTQISPKTMDPKSNSMVDNGSNMNFFANSNMGQQSSFSQQPVLDFSGNNLSHSNNSHTSSSYLSTGSNNSFANSQGAFANSFNSGMNPSPVSQQMGYQGQDGNGYGGSLPTSEYSDYSSSLGSTPTGSTAANSMEVTEVFRGMSLQSRGGSFTSNNGLGSSVGSSNLSVTPDNYKILQALLDPQGEGTDKTIQKLDNFINLFSSFKETLVNNKGNGALENLQFKEMYDSYFSSLQDNRRNQGFKRVRNDFSNDDLSVNYKGASNAGQAHSFHARSQSATGRGGGLTVTQNRNPSTSAPMANNPINTMVANHELDESEINVISSILQQNMSEFNMELPQSLYNTSNDSNEDIFKL